MRAHIIASVALAFVLSVSAPAPANIVTLTNEYTLEEVMTQFPNGFVVLDKVFSDWAFTANAQGGGLAPTPAGITVQGVYFDLNGSQACEPTIDEIGLRFTGGWSAGPGQLVDTVISFKVAATRPHYITDNTLKMTASGSAGTGGASISENVYSDAILSDLVAGKFVVDTPTFVQHEDHVDFSQGYSELWVVKDVNVNGGIGGAAQISEFYNTFSQVPEPASLVLLAVGVLAVIRRRRR